MFWLHRTVSGTALVRLPSGRCYAAGNSAARRPYHSENTSRQGGGLQAEWFVSDFTPSRAPAKTSRMKRLDVALVERGLCASREQARRAVMAGQIRINERPAHKASDVVRDTDSL